MTGSVPTAGGRACIGGLLVLAAIFALLAIPDLDLPGLYYDEVIQAEPAVQFLAPDGRPSHIPGMSSRRWFGGWFPVMTQNYMGALKSQLLIPVFALVEPTAASLRLTTLAVAFAGLVAFVFWLRRTLGAKTALLAGALVATDPSFLYASRHDWGSFAIGFACRCAGLALATSGWRDGGVARLAAAGVCFGLGLYNKIDFGTFLAAAAVGLALAAPGSLRAAISRRRALLLAPAAGLALGAAPLAASLGRTLAAARWVLVGPGSGDGAWSGKLAAGIAVFDGSYFERLMRAGGTFERMFSVEATPGPFGLVYAVASAWLAVRLARTRPWSDEDRTRLFALVTGWLTLVLLLLVPRAERIHHFLNAYPFPHVVVASTVVAIGERAGGRAVRRALASVLAAVVLAGNIAADRRTAAVIRETGGKGRWSIALRDLARELAGRTPPPRVTSFDWGFDGPLRFYARELSLAEPIWALQRPPEPDAVWQTRGGPEDLYLVYDPDHAVFEYGAQLLTAVRALPSGEVEIREHRDRSGDVAFLSVRFARPHELYYRRGFEVHLR